MTKKVALFVSIALSSLSVTTKADNYDATVDMFINMLKQSGSLNTAINCIGTTETTFIKAYKKTLEECIPQGGLEGNCIEELLAENLGVSKEKLDSCDPDDDSDIADQDDDINYAELTEEEIAKEQAEGIARMNQMLDLVKKSSEGTEGEISLPIYSPSTLITNYTRGMENSKGKMTLPMASFTTKDSVEKVARFYETSLPDFEIKHDMSTYYVMKEIPEDLTQLSFDMENLPLYFIPHIAFYSSSASGQKETTIVISYKPK